MVAVLFPTLTLATDTHQLRFLLYTQIVYEIQKSIRAPFSDAFIAHFQCEVFIRIISLRCQSD